MLDLIIFMGQSNMAGRGKAELAPSVIDGAGYEFRAISDPKKLYPITEPFGFYENNHGAIDDEGRKSGGMVSSFVNTYHLLTGRRVIAVSASIGGTASVEWVNNFRFDAAERLKKAIRYLKDNNYNISNIFMLWSQGETDSDNKVSKEEYINNFNLIFDTMREAGIEKCFMIKTGHFNYIKYPENGLDIDRQYEIIRSAQEKIAEDTENVIMAATFEPYIQLMKDPFHYHQEAYNKVGEEAARALSEYLKGAVANE